VFLEVFSGVLGSRYSCAHPIAVPPCGHLNVILRSAKVVPELLFWGVGGRWHTDPSPCNVFSSPHASYRIWELTDVVITVFKLEDFYFFETITRGPFRISQDYVYLCLLKHLVYLKMLPMWFQ